jgi:hypothetical protein
MLSRRQLKQPGEAGKQRKPDNPLLALGVDDVPNSQLERNHVT